MLPSAPLGGARTFLPYFIGADNALASFVAMVFSISSENISEMTAVKAKPQVIEMDDDFGDDEDDED